MTDDEASERLLAAAGRLFYARGIRAVGMDDIRAASGLPLKRIYQCFGSKDRLVEAYLARRDETWLAALADRVGQSAGSRQRLLAVFSFLGEWFATPDFRGCAFINALGELGGSQDAAHEITRRHKLRLREFLAGLAMDAGAAQPEALAAQLLMLIDGAVVSAAAGVDPDAAARAGTAAAALLDVAAGKGTPFDVAAGEDTPLTQA